MCSRRCRWQLNVREMHNGADIFRISTGGGGQGAGEAVSERTRGDAEGGGMSRSEGGRDKGGRVAGDGGEVAERQRPESREGAEGSNGKVWSDLRRLLVDTLRMKTYKQRAQRYPKPQTRNPKP